MNILEQFLAGYKGCLLVISHDRYFMDKVADTLFILENDGCVSGFAGKCSEYLEYRDEKRKEEILQKQAKQAEKQKEELKDRPTESEQDSAKPKKLSFKEQKEFEQLEKDIETLENRKAELEQLMSGGETDFSKIGEISKEYQEISIQLEEKYKRWEELA